MLMVKQYEEGKTINKQSARHLTAPCVCSRIRTEHQHRNDLGKSSTLTTWQAVGTSARARSMDSPASTNGESHGVSSVGLADSLQPCRRLRRCLRSNRPSAADLGKLTINLPLEQADDSKTARYPGLLSSSSLSSPQSRDNDMSRQIFYTTIRSCEPPDHDSMIATHPVSCRRSPCEESHLPMLSCWRTHVGQIH